MSSRLCFKLVFLTVMLLSLISIASADQVALSSNDTLPGMTITELAKFDGKDGHKAYVAVDSIIYDVTTVKQWKNGEHHGNKAGNDITTKIAKAPHSKKPLTKRTKVARLIPEPVTPTATE
jgi:predicted heme/steroid binding protein